MNERTKRTKKLLEQIMNTLQYTMIRLGKRKLSHCEISYLIDKIEQHLNNEIKYKEIEDE